MPDDFAKLFRTDDLGQILVRLAEDDAGDAVVTLTISRGGLWIDATLKIRGGEWEAAQGVLDRMTEERAVEILRGVIPQSGLADLLT